MSGMQANVRGIKMLQNQEQAVGLAFLEELGGAHPPKLVAVHQLPVGVGDHEPLRTR